MMKMIFSRLTRAVNPWQWAAHRLGSRHSPNMRLQRALALPFAV